MPTFGFSGIGASSGASGSCRLQVLLVGGGSATHVATTGDTLDSLHYYGSTTSTQAEISLYDITSGLAAAPLEFTAQSTTLTGSAAWSNITYSHALTNARTYAVASNRPAAVTVYFDTGSASSSSFRTASVLPASWVDEGGSTRVQSMYATYSTAGGGGLAIPIASYHYNHHLRH